MSDKQRGYLKEILGFLSILTIYTLLVIKGQEIPKEFLYVLCIAIGSFIVGKDFIVDFFKIKKKDKDE